VLKSETEPSLVVRSLQLDCTSKSRQAQFGITGRGSTLEAKLYEAALPQNENDSRASGRL